MDKKSSQPIRRGHVAKCGTKRSLLLHFWSWIRAIGRGELIFKKWRVFRERVCNFFLGFPTFESSDFFGSRSKVVLRSEGFAWAPVSGGFDKLLEVRVLPYLIYPLFKCFVNA